MDDVEYKKFIKYFLIKRYFLMMNFILISVSIVVLYFMIILISFNPEDPSWLQTIWTGSIHNFGGVLGAKVSDFLFFIFGIVAYIIPLLIVFCFWDIYSQNVQITVCTFLFKLIGILLLLCTCCGLAQLIINNIFYFYSGGIIGCILCSLIFSDIFFNYTTNLILFVLIGIISILVFFNRFFWIVLKIVRKQLFSIVHNLSILIGYRLKYKYLVNNKESSCHKRYICPSVFSVKDNHIVRNLENNLLKGYIISNISTNFDKFIIQSDSVCKYNIFKVKDIFLLKKLINKFDFIKRLLCYANPYIGKIDYIYNNKYIKNIFFRWKNYFIQTDKYNKKNYFDLIPYDLKEKEQRYDSPSLQHSRTVRISNEHNECSMPVAVVKNTERYSTSDIFKQKDILISQHTSSCLNRQVILFPSINLLTRCFSNKITNLLELKKKSQSLEIKLLEYNIVAHVANIISGPVITRFELNLSPGTKSARISNLSRDLARVLYTSSVRVVEVIPGTSYVGLEIPNKKRSIVYLGDIISSDQFKKFNTPLALALGQSVSGEPIIVDLKSMPHLLVAGTTGSGKSVVINAMIVSILYKATPQEVRFIMIDPKILELSVYTGIPHLLKQVITDIQEVYETLEWCVKEMERRYKIMATLGVRNLESYNCLVKQVNSKERTVNNTTNKGIDDTVNYMYDTLQVLPYIVIIVDEFSDLMLTARKKVEELVIRLTQKARAAGIHMILATQRPSVDVITGLIKANIPARIACTVSSKIDSRTIIGQSGAESLLGMGDMLYLSPSIAIPIRVHGAFIEDKEIRSIVNFWKYCKQ